MIGKIKMEKLKLEIEDENPKSEKVNSKNKDKGM